MFGFIPDQSMIGTIFINFIANTFNVFAQNVKIKIDRANFDFYNKTELQKIVLQYGKTRNILLKRKTKSKDAPQLAIGFNDENMINITLEEQAIVILELFQLDRAVNFIEVIINYIFFSMFM